MRRPEGFDESAPPPDQGDPTPPRRRRAPRGGEPAADAPSSVPAAPGSSTPRGPDDVSTGPVPTVSPLAPGADRVRSLAAGTGERLAGLRTSLGARGGAPDADPDRRRSVGAPAPDAPEAEDRPLPRVGPAPVGAAAARGRAREARRAARRASADRRRVERTEVRRFTRRTRHRRAALVTLAGLLALLVVAVLVAVFSPLLALRTITVEGADRVDAAEVQAALDDQLGTPLALLDFGEVERSLEAFPLIASYVTETAPPDTLVVRISERQPVAAVPAGDGVDLVDPAGVVVQQLDERPEGVPLVDVGAAELDGPLYRAVAEVLLALPVELRATVDAATATTPDDVTLTLTSGERVVWGSADSSVRKAQVLAGLVADQARRDPGASVEYDVSAPDAGIIRTK